MHAIGSRWSQQTVEFSSQSLSCWTRRHSDRIWTQHKYAFRVRKQTKSVEYTDFSFTEEMGTLLLCQFTHLITPCLGTYFTQIARFIALGWNCNASEFGNLGIFGRWRGTPEHRICLKGIFRVDWCLASDQFKGACSIGRTQHFTLHFKIISRVNTLFHCQALLNTRTLIGICVASLVSI